jgi:transposase InsO family protein
VVPIATEAPNDLWTADFKGQFRTGNGVYCYPLTIADQHTRFLLTCHGLLSTETLTAKPVFERAFREYGLPVAIRTDNGCRLRRKPFMACRTSTSGGCAWVSPINAFTRRPRRRTGRTSACTGR